VEPFLPELDNFPNSRGRLWQNSARTSLHSVRSRAQPCSSGHKISSSKLHSFNLLIIKIKLKNDFKTVVITVNRDLPLVPFGRPWYLEYWHDLTKHVQLNVHSPDCSKKYASTFPRNTSRIYKNKFKNEAKSLTHILFTIICQNVERVVQSHHWLLISQRSVVDVFLSAYSSTNLAQLQSFGDFSTELVHLLRLQ